MHARRRIAAVLIAAGALALPLAVAVPASAHQARPANAGTFRIEDDLCAGFDCGYQGSEIVIAGHNQPVYLDFVAGAVFTKVFFDGGWYELQSGSFCLDAASSGGNILVFAESCTGSTEEQWINLSNHAIENRHFGGTGQAPWLADNTQCRSPGSDVCQATTDIGVALPRRRIGGNRSARPGMIRSGRCGAQGRRSSSGAGRLSRSTAARWASWSLTSPTGSGSA